MDRNAKPNRKESNMQELNPGTEYRIHHGDYLFPSYGRFVESRPVANGTVEHVFQVTRTVNLCIRNFALRDADITSIEEVTR